MYVFVNFRNQGSQHIAVQEAPGQVPAGAPRRVSMEDLSFSPGSWSWDQIIKNNFPNLGRLSNFGIQEFL